VLNAAKAIRNAELREKLMQREKLSAVGKAVSMMMHDLRSPIKNIKILTGMMRDEGIKSDWLGMIDQCGEQASAIFEDFLDFIRENPVKKIPVQLEKVIEEGIRLAEAKNTRGPVTIRIGKISDMIVMGDESKLKRCVMNLVSNAIEALLDQKISNPSIDITATTGDGTMLISIRDNGKGIPTEILKSLFEPFVTRQKTNGTGLGLAIVKQYITAHDGEIWVENDNGAVFTIALPL
jgi:signal transduction histidine kinase